MRRNLEKTLLDNLGAVMGVTVQSNCPMRTVAYSIAISRIVEATKLRGLYP